MSLRIVLQKQVDGEWQNTDLGYDFEKVFEILQARIHENLSLNEKEKRGIFGSVKKIERSWTMAEVEAAFESACRFFIKEFKLKTVAVS